MIREQRPFGKHEMYIEGDIVVTVTHGMFTLDEAHLLIRAMQEVIDRYGYGLVLSDNTGLAGMAPEARRESARWSVGKPILGSATIHGSRAVRILIGLLFKAMNLIGKQSIRLEFFQTEEAARQWLNELRREHLAKVKS